MDPRGWSWRSNYVTHKKLDYRQIEDVKANPNFWKQVVTSTVYGLSTQNILQLVHTSFGNFPIKRLRRMAKKGLAERINTNITDLEEPFTCFLLTKATILSRGNTVDISNFSFQFMLQIDFYFFNIESIRGFNSNFIEICSSTSYTFGFPSRIKSPHTNTL